MTGRSFTGVMFSLKISAVRNAPSLAVTLNSSAPLKFSGGVPENVSVAELNVSQDGNGLPSASVAVRARVSPSASEKVPAGI